MDNRFGYYGMDYNLRPTLPEHVNNNIASTGLPYLYYPGKYLTAHDDDDGVGFVNK